MKSFLNSGESLNEWLSNRRWRIFTLCLPVVLAGLVLAIVIGAVLFQGRSELQHRYERIARNALAKGNFEVARVAGLRGLNMSKNDRDRAQSIFFLALAMNGLGHQSEALSLLSDAAPLDPVGAGSFEAHLTVAQAMLSATNITAEAVWRAKSNPTNAVALTLHEAQRHLLSAVAIEPNSEEANEMLARFYIKTHEPARARDRLMGLYAEKPEVALLLAVCSDLENDGPSAQTWAGRALITFENNLLKSAPYYNPEDRRGLVQAMGIEQLFSAHTNFNAQPRYVVTNAVPQDSPLIWLGIVNMLLIKGKTQAALETLERLMHDHPDPAYPPAIGEICAALAQGVPPQQQDGSAIRLRLVEEGLTNAPDNMNLQFLLIRLARETNATSSSAQMLLDQYMAAATGENSAMWHFMLARDAGVRGDSAEKRLQLRSALKLAPYDPQIKNNLAVSELDSTNRADWEAGLKLIQAVLVKYPDGAYFRGTRGLLLARLGRNREAMEDLEFAVDKIPNPMEDREVLARVCQTLGINSPGASPNRLVQVQTLMNDGDYAGAVKALDEAMLVNSNSAYATAMSQVCTAWLENAPPGDPAERLQLIWRGLNGDSQNEKLQSRLLLASRAGGASGIAAKKMLEDFVAQAVGNSAAEWHLFLGKDARFRGDSKTARRELQSAFELAPRQTEIHLELAAVLSAGDTADLPRALDLIQPEVDAFPNDAKLRNLRGRILARLGRNKEAAEDLSFAVDRLANDSDSKETHVILAQVYEALGKSGLAEQQRRLANFAP